MTKIKAFIRLANEPYKIIKWFTANWDKEIGALGLGEIRNGELCVDRLVFPKQIVGGANVHFKPEDWGPIMQELSTEEIGKIIFYWHKHPGSASASLGDEEDTFDVFMCEEANRPYFGFMQTAKKYTGGFEYEARIEMRDPIVVSITDVQLVTKEDNKIGKICKKIIKEKVTEGNASASDQPGAEGKLTVMSKEEYEKNAEDGGYDNTVFKVVKKHGQVKIKISSYLKSWVTDILKSDELKKLVKDFKSDIVSDGILEMVINPKKKKGKDVYKIFKAYIDEMFFEGETVCKKDDKETIADKVKDTPQIENKFAQDKKDPRFWYRGGWGN